jgi:hypothetical protein
VKHPPPEELNLDVNPTMAPPRQKETKKPCGFRLEPEYRDLLIQKAKELNIDFSDLVRRIVIQHLQEEDAKASHYEALCGFKQELLEIRRDITLSTVALLCGAGTLELKEAQKWANRNLSSTD